jgi:hypothetical protein
MSRTESHRAMVSSRVVVTAIPHPARSRRNGAEAALKRTPRPGLHPTYRTKYRTNRSHISLESPRISVHTVRYFVHFERHLARHAAT